MRDDLNDLTIYAAVVDAGSFTEAARKLNMPKSRVSMRVSALESRLNCRLLERTTRKLAVTEAGRLFFESCLRIADEARAGRQIIDSLSGAPRGLLRVSAPFAFARSILAPQIGAFYERFPEITLSIDVDNRAIDLIQGNIDLALRVQRIANQETRFEVIGEFEQRLVASPDYLKKFGIPQRPQDLVSHRVLVAANAQGEAELWHETGHKRAIVTVKPYLAIGEPESRAVLIKSGIGIGWLPDFLCCSELDDGTLVECLPNDPLPKAIMYAATPTVRAYDTKVRALVEFLREVLSRDS